MYSPRLEAVAVDSVGALHGVVGADGQKSVRGGGHQPPLVVGDGSRSTCQIMGGVLGFRLELAGLYIVLCGRMKQCQNLETS